MRSSTSAALRASRISSGADWSRAPCVVSFTEHHWPGHADHRTVAAPTCAATPSKPSYLHHPVERLSRPMRRAEGLDGSSFAAQDACAPEQPLPAKRSPCRAGLPAAAPAYPSGRRRTEGAALGGCIACTVNGVGREEGGRASRAHRLLPAGEPWAHQHRQGDPERGGDHARSGRCLRRVNHGARTAPRQGRG